MVGTVLLISLYAFMDSVKLAYLNKKTFILKFNLSLSRDQI